MITANTQAAIDRYRRSIQDRPNFAAWWILDWAEAVLEGDPDITCAEIRATVTKLMGERNVCQGSANDWHAAEDALKSNS